MVPKLCHSCPQKENEKSADNVIRSSEDWKFNKKLLETVIRRAMVQP